MSATTCIRWLLCQRGLLLTGDTAAAATVAKQ
jgi:hypothetical protein